jgi:KipI family sensor histidine kinase inhibitor
MKTASSAPVRYLPFGDAALLIEFGDTINPEISRRVLALNTAISKARIEGVEELVPTYRSLLVRYDPLRTSYEQLVFRVKDVEGASRENIEDETSCRRIVVPVVYGGEYGPDLGYVARLHGLSEEQVVGLHSGREYRVYMVGFVAGFPYLGDVADEIATPRLLTPRLKVTAGSVGIAEKQTGIYPCEAPGGWQIVGRTFLRLFDPTHEPPALLNPGDRVRFQPISEDEYRASLGR